MEDYIRQHLSSLRQELMEWTRGVVREWVANLLTSTTIARASESDDDPLVDDVQLWSTSDGFSSSNNDSGETAQPRARRMEPTGFACVPVKGEVSKVLGIGANLLHFAVASTRYRPKGLKQTEWAIYNLRDAAQQLVVKGDKNSALTISVGGFLHVEIDQAGKITLASRGGARVVLDADTLATTLLRATHFGGNLAAPPPTAFAGTALAGGTAVVVGTDAAMLITMAVKAPGGVSGILCSIRFGTPYDVPPQFSITAAGLSPVLILAGVVPVGMGAVRGQASQAQLDIYTDLPISTGPLMLSVMVKQ